MWNLWHGCHKISQGCRNCYVFRRDAQIGKDANEVYKTGSFDLPVRRKKNGEYKIPSGEHLWTCFTSDLFIEEADLWRQAVWEMIRERPDLTFSMITKRVHRVLECLPADWGEGYDNVRISCTIENQEQAGYRFPIYKSLPIRHKSIICEPLIGETDLSPWLDDSIESVTVGGESGNNACVCDFAWVLKIRDACVERNIPFHFKQTGANFVKDGVCYKIARKHQCEQARKAGIDT